MFKRQAKLKSDGTFKNWFSRAFYSSKVLAESIGGCLNFQSEVNKGTTVTFEIQCTTYPV